LFASLSDPIFEPARRALAGLIAAPGENQIAWRICWTTIAVSSSKIVPPAPPSVSVGLPALDVRKSLADSRRPAPLAADSWVALRGQWLYSS